MSQSQHRVSHRRQRSGQPSEFARSRQRSPCADDVDDHESPALASTPHHSPRPAPTGAEGRFPTKQFPIYSAARFPPASPGARADSRLPRLKALAVRRAAEPEGGSGPHARRWRTAHRTTSSPTTPRLNFERLPWNRETSSRLSIRRKSACPHHDRARSSSRAGSTSTRPRSTSA